MTDTLTDEEIGRIEGLPVEDEECCEEWCINGYDEPLCCGQPREMVSIDRGHLLGLCAAVRQARAERDEARAEVTAAEAEIDRQRSRRKTAEFERDANRSRAEKAEAAEIRMVSSYA